MTSTPPATTLGSPRGASESFERLLAPLSVEEFFSRYWGERWAIVRRDDPSYYAGLFGFSDLARYLSLAARQPASHVSLIKAGQPVQRMSVKSVPPSRLHAAFHGGSTLLLEDVDATWAPVARLADMLRRTLSARIAINAYVTPPGAQGAHLHPDIKDVLAIQLEGSKDWWLSSERVHEPIEGFSYMPFLTDPAVKASYLREESSVALEPAKLVAGDLLYMPRGVVHKAVATKEGPSLHLAITIEPVSWMEFVKALAEVATARDPVFCRSLPPGFEKKDPASLAASLRPTFDDVIARLTSEENVTRTLEVLGRAREADIPYRDDDHFEQILRLSELSASSVVERRASIGCYVSATNEGASIRFGLVEIKGPETIGPVLVHIRDHDRFAIADLPGPHDTQSKLVLVRRLVREGLLRVDHAADGVGPS